MAIACISAFPASVNPGMVSCDLAFASVLDRLGIDGPVDRFNLERSGRIGDMDSRRLDDVGVLEDYAAIVFWGDFQHFLNYARIDLWRRMRSRGQVDRKRFVDDWIDLAFLGDRAPLQKKTIIFGETIYGTGSVDLANQRYARALRGLLTNAAQVQFRDPLSVALARQLAPKGKISFGADCAFLLDSNRMLPMEEAQARLAARAPARYGVCCFGRSGENERLDAFAHALAGATGCDLVRIDWLRPPQTRAIETIADNVAAVRGAQFVVTDIYHLIVTTIREGGIALALGWGASRGRSTMEDKKKELLMRAYFGQHLYMYLEDVIGNEKDALARAIESLRLEASAGLVARFAENHRKQSERRFGKALRGLTQI